METSKLLYEDTELLVVIKPNLMPVQSDKSGDLDLTSYWAKMKKQNIYLVNRMDRPVSGVVVFTKNKKTYQKLKESWNDPPTIKEYLAITEGKWKRPVGNLHNRLIKSRSFKAVEDTKGKSSTLSYKVILEMDRYSLLKVQLQTGRFHQIRAQLSLAGHPVKGDIKYGARRKNQDRSIHLHCYRIALPKGQVFEALPPNNDRLWQISVECLTSKN